LPRPLLRGTDANSIGQTFGVDAANQFDSDVDISIGSAGNYRRRKIVPLYHAQRVAAPTKANAQMRLRSKPHLVGMDSDEQQHIGRTGFRASNSE
jgi:hypothetical protein